MRRSAPVSRRLPDVFRHVTRVLPDHLGTFAELDPTAPGLGGHMNFDVVLRRCGHAWSAMLAELGGFGEGTIVPRLEVDYHGEVREGELVVEVRVVSTGRTSFRVRCNVLQDDVLKARADVVLVHFDYATQQPVPLTEEQRAALASRTGATEDAALVG